MKTNSTLLVYPAPKADADNQHTQKNGFSFQRWLECPAAMLLLSDILYQGQWPAFSNNTIGITKALETIAKKTNIFSQCRPNFVWTPAP